jgi:hypothetical protein
MTKQLSDTDRLCLSMLINNSKKKPEKMPKQTDTRRQILQQCFDKHLETFMGNTVVESHFDAFIKKLDARLSGFEIEFNKWMSGKRD